MCEGKSHKGGGGGGLENFVKILVTPPSPLSVFRMSLAEGTLEQQKMLFFPLLMVHWNSIF